MNYIHSTTNEVQTKRAIVDSIKAYTSLGPNTLTEMGWTPVLAAPKPAPSSNIKSVRSTAPVQDANGNWVEGYEEVDMFSDTTDEDGVTTTKAEHEAAHIAGLAVAKETGIRTDRDQRIALTDWTGMSDVTMSADMATYRQALRDITIHANFPDLAEADWPVSP